MTNSESGKSKRWPNTKFKYDQNEPFEKQVTRDREIDIVIKAHAETTAKTTNDNPKVQAWIDKGVSPIKARMEEILNELNDLKEAYLELSKTAAFIEAKAKADKKLQEKAEWREHKVKEEVKKEVKKELKINFKKTGGKIVVKSPKAKMESLMEARMASKYGHKAENN